MSVRQLKNGKWVADVTVGTTWDGKRDRRVVEYSTKREAQKGEAKLFLERERNQGQSSRITFEDFVDEVFWPQKKNLRSNTKRGYKRDLNLRLLPEFGNMQISDIKHIHVQKMISNCTTKKVATNARETLSAVLGLAESVEMITHNPARGKFIYPEQPPSRPDKYGEWITSFSEHRDFLIYVRENCYSDSLERMLVLGLCFGLRKGEIFGMDWERVDFENKEISIIQTYTVGEGKASLTPPKTDRSIRTIPIPQYALERLQEWHKQDGCPFDVDNPTPIVRIKTGERMNPRSGDSMLKLFIDKHGEKVPRVTLFSLRHSFATACIRNGIDVATVSKWLGHADVSTTHNRYVKPLLSDLHKDVSIIDHAYTSDDGLARFGK